MYPVIEPAERAVLEEKLRTVLGSGAATTALLKIVDAVNASIRRQRLSPCSGLEATAEEHSALTDQVDPALEVQVTESSP